MKPVPKSYDNLIVPSQAIYQLAKRRQKPETLLEILVQGLPGGLYVGTLREWLDNGTFDANERDSFGRVPLMGRVHTHSGYIEILLEKGADCMAVDNDGNTMLMYWIDSYGIKNSEIEFLLQKGVDINAVNKQGFTALDMGIYLGIDIIPLLKHGAKWVSIPPQCIDGVFLSAWMSWDNIHTPFLKQFLKRLFQEGIPSPSAWEEILEMTSRYSFDKDYDWLFQQYETYYKKEAFEFQNAFEYNRKKVLEMIKNRDYKRLASLSERHIHPDFGIHYVESCWQFRDENGNEELSPLMYAIGQNDARAVRILLDAGANPTAGYSRMDIDDTGVACAIENNNMEILQMLIDAHADLNFAIRCNRTPVITAAKQNNLTALTMLVNAGANPVLKDEFGRIPLGFISEEEQPDAYRYLSKFKP